MSELEKTPPTQSEVDALLDPDILSGRQIAVLKKMDEKNVDTGDLEAALAGFLVAYEAAKATDPPPSNDGVVEGGQA